MRRRLARLAPALTLLSVLAAAAAAAPRAQAQDGGERFHDAPSFVLNPRPRAGWVPVRLDVQNFGAERASLRIDLVNPGRADDLLIDQHEVDLEGGGRRTLIGYVWGKPDGPGWSDMSGPATGAQFSVSDGSQSRHFNIGNERGAEVVTDGWQIAVIGPRRLTFRSAQGERITPGVVPLRPATRQYAGDRRPGNPDPNSWGAQRVIAAAAGSAKTVLAEYVKKYPIRLIDQRVPPELAPGHLVGWDPADAVVVTAGPHLDAMTPNARGALLQWAALGGVVIVCPGESTADLEHPLLTELLGELTPPARAGSAPDGAADAVAAAMGQAAEAYWPALPRNATPLVSWGDDVMLAARPFGRGWAFYCALDLTRTSPRGSDAPRGDPGRAINVCLQHARAHQASRAWGLGHRQPGTPAGETPYSEMPWSTFKDRARAQRALVERPWFSADTTDMQALVNGIHTGRERMPSPWAVTFFLLLYLVALGPGVWWLRKKRGGGLVGIPLTIGTAALFAVGAVVFGLATRGVGLVTQRVTVLWPVPGRPIAGEQTAVSLFAGIARQVDVTFPGQVAPLPVSPDGHVGGGARLTIALGATQSQARDVRIGSWSTRVLLAEGARSIGGVLQATAPAAALRTRTKQGGAGMDIDVDVTIRNGSTLPLEPGVLWIVRHRRDVWVHVPALAPGAVHTVAMPSNRKTEAGSIEAALGLPEPEDWRRRSVLGLVLGPNRQLHDRLGRESMSPLVGDPVYIAPVKAEHLPGGGPECPGTRERDIVLCVVTVEPAR